MTHHPLRSHCEIKRAIGLDRVGAILGCGFIALVLGACATKSQPASSTSMSTEPAPPPKPNASRSPPLALRDCEARVLFAAYASERPEKGDRKCRKGLYRKLKALDLKALEELDEYRREDRERRKAERKAGKDFFPSDPQQDERVLNRLMTLGQRHPGDVSLELLITRFLFIVDPEGASAGRQRLEKLVQRVPNDSRVRMLAAEMELMTGHVVRSLEHSVACLRHSPEVESCRLVYDQAVEAFKMPYCSSTPPTLALQIASRPKGYEEYAPKTDETIAWPPKNRPLYESIQSGDTLEVVDIDSLPPAEHAAGEIAEDVIEVPDGRGLFVLAKEKVVFGPKDIKIFSPTSSDPTRSTGPQWKLGFQLTPDAAKRLLAFTESHRGKTAVVFVNDAPKDAAKIMGGVSSLSASMGDKAEVEAACPETKLPELPPALQWAPPY